METPRQPPLTWTFHTDGTSSIDGSGVGFVMTPLDGGKPLRYAPVLNFKATNNKAEYEVLITALRLAKGIDVASLKVYCDSQLVVYQVKSKYTAKGGDENISQRGEGAGRELQRFSNKVHSKIIQSGSRRIEKIHLSSDDSPNPRKTSMKESPENMQM